MQYCVILMLWRLGGRDCLDCPHPSGGREENEEGRRFI
jgi:hypothetical protein